MLKVNVKGDWKRTDKYLKNAQNFRVRTLLDKYGALGVSALANATPVRTGVTAMSWQYRITLKTGGYTIEWFNTNVVNGSPIAILIQYGHGTGTGGYVQGRDYINPAMRPIFDKMAEDLWKEVSNL